jgi:pyruvate,water dikinase
VSCAEGDTGRIYDGLLETEVTEVQRGAMPEIATKIMMNVGNPQLAFDFAQLPNEGVGLARLEFIINNNIGVHPKAILDYPNGRCRPEEGRGIRGARPCQPRAFLRGQAGRGRGHHRRGLLAQAGDRAPVDFKSNEYRKLIGGSRYEPEEENPMLGFRGAARYISADFGDCLRDGVRGASSGCATTWA